MVKYKMSEKNYCPETDNDPDYEVVETSDTESEEDEFDKNLKLGDKINQMIDKEIKDKFSVPDRMSMKPFEDLKTESFKTLTDLEKINKVAKAFWDTGGIDVENILELKMLMVLIGATEQLEGFKEFPRDSVYKLLEMIIYHCNKHMESLNV
tara:strand:+ start:1023 stop:1478 length:456 start_codon:yes stop_codon:yes gene_type:complete